jgi:hypothetical protein
LGGRQVIKSSGGGSNAPVQREHLPLPRRAAPEATVTLGTRMLQVCVWSNLQSEQLPLRLPQRRLHLACAGHTRHHPGRQHVRLFTRNSLTSVSLGIRCLQLQRPHLTLGSSHCTRALRSDTAVGKERVRWAGGHRGDAQQRVAAQCTLPLRRAWHGRAQFSTPAAPAQVSQTPLVLQRASHTFVELRL